MTVIDKENENLKVEASDLKKKIAKANDDIKTKDKIIKQQKESKVKDLSDEKKQLANEDLKSKDKII